MGKPSVHIVGAGIIGLATACVLLRKGYEVTIIDRWEPGEGASRGNAAAIAWTDVAPLASPGIWRKAPGWLLDPLGPLSVRPAYALKALPWMMKFMAASRPLKVEASTKAIAALNAQAVSAWERLWSDTGTGWRVRREGCLEVFDDPRQLERQRAVWDGQRAFGIKVEELGRDAILAMEPCLSPEIVGGGFLPGWMQVDDPRALCKDLAVYAGAKGARFVRGEVVHAGLSSEGALVQMGDGASVSAGKLVIACGAWSRNLAEFFGDRTPLDTERGYNLTVPEPGVALKRFIMLPGYGFVLSPLSIGLRIGGAVEFAGLEAAANWRRVDALVTRAKRIVPGLRSEGGERWMGFRPSLPDSLPVISKASHTDHVYYAFGHAHHGLTQAAATAERIAEMIDGEAAPIDMTPYRADRF